MLADGSMQPPDNPTVHCGSSRNCALPTLNFTTERASACACHQRPPGEPPPAAVRPRPRRRTARAPRRARSRGALRAARLQQPPLPALVTAARATRRAPEVLSARARACRAAASAAYRLSEYALELSPLRPPSRVLRFFRKNPVVNTLACENLSHATGLGRAPPQAWVAARAGGRGRALWTDGGAGARPALTGLPPGLAQTLHTSLDMQHQRWT